MKGGQQSVMSQSQVRSNMLSTLPDAFPRASCWQTQTQALDFLSQSCRTRACWSRPHPPSLPSCHQTLPGSRTWMPTRVFDFLLPKDLFFLLLSEVLLMHSNMWYLVPVQWCDYSSDRNQLLWCDISSFKTITIAIRLYRTSGSSLDSWMVCENCISSRGNVWYLSILADKNHIFSLVKVYWPWKLILITKLHNYWKSDRIFIVRVKAYHDLNLWNDQYWLEYQRINLFWNTVMFPIACSNHMLV